MTAQIICLAAARKARQINRDEAGAIFLAPVRIGASLTKTWLDAFPIADLRRWAGMED